VGWPAWIHPFGRSSSSSIVWLSGLIDMGLHGVLSRLTLRDAASRACRLGGFQGPLF